MKVLKLAALILGVALFTGMGTTTLSADMKCGAGKCGGSMEKTPKVCTSEENCKCDCEHSKKGKMKCGSAKCGGSDKGTSGKSGKMCNSKDGCKCECHPKKGSKKD